MSVSESRTNICSKANTCSLICLCNRLSTFSQSCNFKIAFKVTLKIKRQSGYISHSKENVYYIPCNYLLQISDICSVFFAIEVTHWGKNKTKSKNLSWIKSFDIKIKLRTEECGRKVIQIKWYKQVTEHCCKVMEIWSKFLRKNSIEHYQLWST